LQRLGTHLRDLHGGPAEDLGPVHGQVGLPDVVGTGVDLVDVGLEVLGLADRATLLAVGTPDHRADVVGVGRAHHHGAGAVAEDERGVAVGEVDAVAHLLHADHHDVPGGAAADHVGRDRQAVPEPGAAGGEV